MPIWSPALVTAPLKFNIALNEGDRLAPLEEDAREVFDGGAEGVLVVALFEGVEGVAKPGLSDEFERCACHPGQNFDLSELGIRKDWYSGVQQHTSAGPFATCDAKESLSFIFKLVLSRSFKTQSVNALTLSTTP